MDVEHRQPIEPCFAHATAQVSLEESQAADGTLILDTCNGLCTSDLHNLPDALTTNKRSISILDVRFPTSQTGIPTVSTPCNSVLRSTVVLLS